MNAKILCVDDNPAVADALRCLIELEPDLRWAGHLESADDLIRRSAALHPDIILLDLDLPGRAALDVLPELIEVAPHQRTIILSGFMSQALLDAAADAGAWGYVNKNDGPAAIIQAIRRVLQGDCVFEMRSAPVRVVDA